MAARYAGHPRHRGRDDGGSRRERRERLHVPSRHQHAGPRFRSASVRPASSPAASSCIGVTHTITVDFFAWTPGTHTVHGSHHEGRGAPVGDRRWARSTCRPRAVAPSPWCRPRKISINGALAQRRTASFTTLKLTLHPRAGHPAAARRRRVWTSARTGGADMKRQHSPPRSSRPCSSRRSRPGRDPHLGHLARRSPRASR